MIFNRIELDLPDYLHLLTGYYQKDEAYKSQRKTGTDDYLLIATLDGSGCIRIGNTAFETKKDNLVLFTPHTEHDYSTAEQYGYWELLWVHFHPRPHWIDWLQWPEYLPGISFLDLTGEPNKDAIIDTFRKMHRLAMHGRLNSTFLAMTALEELLLNSISIFEGRKRNLDSRISETLSYINENLKSKVIIEELAERVHLSPSRFSHLFKLETGISPIEYAEMCRIERAKILLERTSGTIGDIASEIGQDPVYFSIRFKQHVGCSPRDYRMRYRKTYISGEI